MEFTDIDFREKILRLAGDLFYIKQYLVSIVTNAGKSRHASMETIEQSLKLIKQSDELAKAAEWHKFYGMMAYTNTLVCGMFHDRNDEGDYSKKKAIASEFNAYLRDHDAAIAHPLTKEPCLLLAISSRDGRGRYALENKITKKRTGSHKSVVDLTPIHFVKAIPRKEGFVSKKETDSEKSENVQRFLFFDI